MTEVFLVRWECWDFYCRMEHIAGIYSTRDLADARLEAIHPAGEVCHVEVEPMLLDADIAVLD